jgi:hypothetical protein
VHQVQESGDKGYISSEGQLKENEKLTHLIESESHHQNRHEYGKFSGHVLFL